LARAAKRLDDYKSDPTPIARGMMSACKAEFDELVDVHSRWVNADGQDFRVRYYLSTAGGEGRMPVVFLQGDKFGKLDIATNSYPAVPQDQRKDINTDDLTKTADGFSEMAKTTAIYLARIGVDGTSGNHVARKTLLELHLMNAALEAIKQRHGFAGFHLVGQSGGSKLIGGLIGLRRDIACAVLGSGPLSEPVNNKRASPSRSYFDAADAISVAARTPSLRPFVISDPMDRKVAIDKQTRYLYARWISAADRLSPLHTTGKKRAHRHDAGPPRSWKISGSNREKMPALPGQ
jgi:hypothetical protein